MTDENISTYSPRWRAHSSGATALITMAAARLRKAIFKNSTKQRTNQIALTNCLDTILDWKSKVMAKEAHCKDIIRSIRAEGEARCREIREENAELSKEIVVLKNTLEQLQEEASGSRVNGARCGRVIQPEPQPHCMEACLSAQKDSLQADLDQKMSELSKERKKVEQLRQAKADLPAVLQRVQAAQTMADSLIEELRRKPNYESILIQQNAAQDHLPLHNDHNIEKQYTYVSRLSPHSKSNEAMSSFEKNITKHNLTYLENFVPSSSKITDGCDEIRIQSSSIHYSGDCLSKLEKTSRFEFFLDYSNTLNIKGVVVKNNSVSWFVELKVRKF